MILYFKALGGKTRIIPVPLHTLSHFDSHQTLSVHPR